MTQHLFVAGLVSPPHLPQLYGDEPAGFGLEQASVVTKRPCCAKLVRVLRVVPSTALALLH